MSFLHCHTKNCNWEQDDFWTLGKYNPITSLKDIEEKLFVDKMYFDIPTLIEMGIPYQLDEIGKSHCKGTDYVAWELERKAKNIRNILVKTYDEYKAQKDTLKCPRCGQQNWDID